MSAAKRTTLLILWSLLLGISVLASIPLKSGKGSTGIGSTAFTYSYGNQGLMISRSGANRK